MTTVRSYHPKIFTMKWYEEQYRLLREQQEPPVPTPTEPSHYWHLERKTKRGKKWVFVREYFGTEKAADDFFDKNYKDRTDYEYRLRKIYTY